MKDLDENPNKVLIPEISRFCYLNIFNQFIHWINEHKIQEINEEALIVYFDELNKSGFAPTALYKISSAIKSTLLAILRIDINEYKLLKKLLSIMQHYLTSSTDIYKRRNISISKDSRSKFIKISSSNWFNVVWWIEKS